MYRRYHTKDEVVQEILGALNELCSIKIERAKELSAAAEEVDFSQERDPARFEQKSIRRLAWLIEEFQGAINYGESELEENEQLRAIDQLISTDMVKEAGHMSSGKDRVKIIRGYFADVVRQKQDAYRVFAKLVDEQRVRMLAIKMLAASVEHSATHREKDTKLRMMVQNIDALIHDLTGIDKDHPHYYEYGWKYSDVGSWDYAKAITQLHHENSRVSRMEKEIEELRKKLAQYEPPAENGKEPVQDEVNF